MGQRALRRGRWRRDRAVAAASRESGAGVRGRGGRAAGCRAAPSVRRARLSSSRRDGARPGCGASPSGTSRLPSSTAFVSVSGVDVNFLAVARRRCAATATARRPRHRGARAKSVRAARHPQDRGRSFPPIRHEESCSTPRAAAAPSCARSRGAAPGSHRGWADRCVKSSRAASATARSMRTGSSRKRTSRIADAADDAGAQIVETADVVDDRERRDVVEQRVDREVAAERVFFRRAERVVAMNEMRFVADRAFTPVIRLERALLAHGIVCARRLVVRDRMVVMIGSGHAVLRRSPRPAAPGAGTSRPR